MPSFNYITPSYGEAESAHGLRSNLSSDRPSNGTMPFNVDRFTPFVPSGNRPAFNLDRPQRATTWTNPSSNFTNFSVTRPRGSLMNPAVPDFVPHGRGLDSRPVPDIDRTQRVTPWTNVSSSNATNSIHHSTSHIASNTNVSNIDPTPMGHGLVSRPVLNIDRSQRVSPWNYISSSNTSTNSIHHNTSHITSNINVSHTNPAPNNSQNGSSHRPYNAVDTFRSLYVRERARFNAELADIQRPVTTLPSPAPASSLDSRPVLNIDGSERAAPERAAPERAAPEQAAPPTNLAQSSSAHSLDINRSERASLTNLTQSSSAPSLDINRSEQAAPPTNLFHSSSAPSLDINRSERAAPPTNLFQSSSAPTSFSNPPLNSRLVLTIDRSQRVTPWSNLSSSNGLAHSTDYGTSRAPKSNNIPRINSTLSAPTSSTPAQLTSSIAGQKRRLELSEGEEERPSIPFSLQATPYSLTMASAKIPTTPEIRPPGRWPGGTPITPRLVDRQNSRQEGPSRMTAIRNMWQNRLMRVANNRMIQRASQAARWAAHRNVLQNRMTRAVYNGVIQHAPQAARRAVHVVDTFKRRVQQIFQRPARIRNETPVEQVRAAINIWANPDTDLAVGNEIIRPEPMDIDSAVENVTVINETMDVGTEAVSNEVTNTDSGIVNDSAIVNNSATASKKRAAPDSDEAVSPPKRTKASSRRVQGALKTQSKGEKRRAEQIRPLKSALRRPSGASSKPKQAADDEVDQGTSKPPRRVHFPRCHEVTAEHILTPINEAPRRYRNLSYDDRYDAAPPSLDHLLDDFGRSMVESVKSASPKVCLVEQKENKAPASEATISNQLRRSARIRNGNAKAENSSSANQGASAMTPRDRHGQDPFRREAEQYPMGRAMSAVESDTGGESEDQPAGNKSAGKKPAGKKPGRRKPAPREPQTPKRRSPEKRDPTPEHN
ncbi:uncharacterized protein BP01DRAFT_794 [Aspergillus saccharolyticus JOP 1030-1]|uniref:Uncharacterized protein n=1 Tax=Aspergillus saccharolyticus JOP 1030-1 TaxID=1450539 RepID=A0A318ZPP7_9EURO|nr:hypothetical protein BP01DRAFT_794 [Aspergillus saccharolyticus JOP 1030-1]PYH49569.1 hypothetical protein BP01DRAFT_794 [Aspergillus saccharolyticus JOP 1030-1]